VARRAGGYATTSTTWSSPRSSRACPGRSRRATTWCWWSRAAAPTLDLVAGAGTTHADTVGQIHLERWSRGRVVLLGDAAWCPTLHSGHGSALAGGESLGRHLALVDGTAPDVPAALRTVSQPWVARALRASPRARA
jgi:2-polyprenyl-6-methoxyphenol hydroxylase-like FAD-dependent oxidoreductase